MRVKLEPLAKLDLREARSWYEDKNPSLGTAFGEDVAEIVAVIKKYPETFPTVFKHARRAPLARFPYGLFYVYERELDLVKILAVVHAARHPSTWKRRM